VAAVAPADGTAAAAAVAAAGEGGGRGWDLEEGEETAAELEEENSSPEKNT